MNFIDSHFDDVIKTPAFLALSRELMVAVVQRRSGGDRKDPTAKTGAVEMNDDGEKDIVDDGKVCMFVSTNYR